MSPVTTALFTFTATGRSTGTQRPTIVIGADEKVKPVGSLALADSGAGVNRHLLWWQMPSGGNRGNIAQDDEEGKDKILCERWRPSEKSGQHD